MKKSLTAATSLLTIALAIPAFSADSAETAQQPAPDFERIKADYLKKLDEHIASFQKQKNCVQESTNLNALGACFSDHKTDMRKQKSREGKTSPEGK